MYVSANLQHPHKYNVCKYYHYYLPSSYSRRLYLSLRGIPCHFDQLLSMYTNSKINRNSVIYITMFCLLYLRKYNTTNLPASIQYKSCWIYAVSSFLCCQLSFYPSDILTEYLQSGYLVKFGETKICFSSLLL